MWNRRRLLLFASLPVALVLSLAVTKLIPYPGVTKANLNRVATGMTKAQVQEIFGREGIAWDGLVEKGRADYWLADETSGALILFVDDRVVDKQWMATRETIHEKVLRWLRFE